MRDALLLADACAAVDERLEAIALEYLERVGGCVVARGTDVSTVLATGTTAA